METSLAVRETQRSIGRVSDRVFMGGHFATAKLPRLCSMISLDVHLLYFLDQVLHVVFVLGLVLCLVNRTHLFNYFLNLSQDVLFLLSL